MINLLPVYEKKKIRKEYVLRLVAVVLFFVSGLIAVNIILLVPTFILSSFEYKSASNQLITEKENLSKVDGSVDPIKIAVDVNSKLDVLRKEGYKTPLAHEVISIITKNKPKNIKIGSIFYDRSSLTGKATVSGVSRDRETLLVFLRSLEKEDAFSGVDLPISSFVEGKDIEFSLVVNIIKKESDAVKIDNNEEKY